MSFYENLKKGVDDNKKSFIRNQLPVEHALKILRHNYALIDECPQWLYSETDSDDDVSKEITRYKILEAFVDLQAKVAKFRPPFDVRITGTFDKKGSLRFHVKQHFVQQDRYLDHPVYLEIQRLSQMIKTIMRSRQ